MRQRIIYTLPSREIGVVVPSDNCVAWMGCGGRWGDDVPKGFLDVQIERWIEKHNLKPDAARGFVNALRFGGHTTSEALDRIADKDARPYGTAVEVIDRDDLPDRWFRDAWRRSPNGGPVDIDISTARCVQKRRINSAYREYLRRQKAEADIEAFDTDMPSLPRPLARFDIGRAINRADSAEEIRAVWLDWLPIERQFSRTAKALAAAKQAVAA